MKRIFDIFFSFFILIIIIIPLLIISFFIFLDSGFPIIFWSKRMGIHNSIFLMPKFRTMNSQTPVVATHLMENPSKYITNIGYYLRKYSLDELPQIWSIFIGNMTFIGPRPALFNQQDLISLRTKKYIHILKPGITGWAQVNGRDNISIMRKVNFDRFYLENRSIYLDVKIIFLTIFKSLRNKDISH